VKGNEFLFQVTPFIGWILKQPHATIPAQDGIVVSYGTDPLRLGEGVQGLVEKGEQRTRRLTRLELRLGAPLVENSGVVKPLVWILEPAEDLFGFPVTIGSLAGELIGKCEPE